MISLTNTEVTCMLPVKDMLRARQFYDTSLGLQPVGDQPDGKFIYQCGGTRIALFPKPEGTKAQHTALSFRVDNITETIQLMEKRGVTFADYDFPDLKTNGHVCVLGSEKAAWFEDTEGNILCLHEDLS